MDARNEFQIGLGLEGSHCVITGASGQIGQVVVKAFVAAGCNVTALDLRVQDASMYPGNRVRWKAADIRDEALLEGIFEEAAEVFGPISICVAAAGKDLSFIAHHDTMAEMSLEQWQQTIQTNLTGAFLTARTWMRGIQRAKQEMRNVSLILFSSEAASMGVKSNADYSSSKAGLGGLLVSLAPDVAKLHPGARVNAVAPGPVDTPQFRRECAEASQARWVESEATVAQGKAVPIEAVARACLFLASERYSGSITGQTLHVDGGKSGKLFHLPDGKSC